MYYPVLCFDERKPMAQVVIVDTMDEDSNVYLEGPRSTMMEVLYNLLTTYISQYNIGYSDGYDDAMDDLNDDDFDSGDIDVI